MPAKELVLLIEDNPGFRFLFKDVLEFLGHDVLEAEDGQSGIEIAQTERPSLILLDLMIPRLHGFEVLSILKSKPSTRHIPVVVLSVLNEPKDIEKSFHLGAGDYIVKGLQTPEQIVKRSCALMIKA